MRASASTPTGRTLVLVTDKPVYFVGGGRAESAPRKGFEVAVIEIRIDAKGAGTGSMAGRRGCGPMATAACCSTTTPRC